MTISMAKLNRERRSHSRAEAEFVLEGVMLGHEQVYMEQVLSVSRSGLLP